MGSHNPGIATAYSLSQNYPNPFNPATTIRYALPVQSEKLKVQGEGKGTFDFEPSTFYVSLKIHNILGQEVRTLVDEVNGPGYYSVTWDGRDGSGREVSTGVYFYRLRAGTYSSTKRMVLLK